MRNARDTYHKRTSLPLSNYNYLLSQEVQILSKAEQEDEPSTHGYFQNSTANTAEGTSSDGSVDDPDENEGK